jgi:hypothetical protein
MSAETQATPVIVLSDEEMREEIKFALERNKHNKAMKGLTLLEMCRKLLEKPVECPGCKDPKLKYQIDKSSERKFDKLVTGKCDNCDFSYASNY